MGFFRNDDRRSDDNRAVERYRYLLQTAPPEQIERAHEEAFAKLTPEQRRQVLEELSQYVPPDEIRGDDPASLARTATRAEMRQPGTLDRAWAGPGLGSMFLSTLAGAFVGSAIADAFFGDPGDGDGGEDSGDGDGDGDTGDAGDAGDGGFDTADSGGDFGGDLGGGDFGGGDFGGF
jgi:hypothetical protein